MESVETCVRGFSYMPKENVSTESLQYIEGEELTRKWRASCRERQKHREQQIWEEFVVKEKDVLTTLCKEDPYQFLEQLPEECLKELMEAQLKKMKEEREREREKEEEDAKLTELSQHGEGDSPAAAPEAVQDMQHVVTFAEELDKEDEIFHIFDDKDEDKSGAEEDVTDSLSPSTVRERSDLSPPSRPHSPDKGSSKSSENVCNLIENSIYFAKVKNLRAKISEELDTIVLSLENRDVMNIDPGELVKMCRRSAEFSARFNRVHVYQLKRQVNDLERNNGVSLPFAKHTQFQAQMARITSLHQNILQAFQIFQKSIEQTACVSESIDTLRGLVAVCRQGMEASHQHLTVAGSLSSDKVLPSCDCLDEALNEYAAKLSSYMESTENTHTSHSRKSGKSKEKKSSFGSSGLGGNKSMGSGTRLSMYSLDTQRVKGSKCLKSSKGSSGTSKLRGARAQPAPPVAPDSPPKKRKRSPRCRRPLMRDPDTGRSKSRRKIPRDTEIRTLVETVGTVTCTSSRVSCELPLSALKPAKRRSRSRPPRAACSQPPTPRKSPLGCPSPLARSPSPANGKRRQHKEGSIKALNSARTEEVVFSTRQSVKVESKKGGETPRKIGQDVRQAKCAPCAPSPSPSPSPSPRSPRESPSSRVARGDLITAEKRCEIARERAQSLSARCEVTRIVRQLCGGDTAGSRNERVTGAKNAQLLCVSGSSPRQPSTPQLLRILEETIQKKLPKQLFSEPTARDRERFSMTLSLPEATSDKLFQYRTQFVQHMLTSAMYANSVVGKPWEVISRISDQIIDDLLATAAKEIQLEGTVQKLYEAETR